MFEHDESNKILLIYTTVNTGLEAQKLANIALSNKLAFCVNITSGKSVYFWDGDIESSDECYMLFKTTVLALQKLEDCIRKNHPYEMPIILKLNADASPEVLKYATKFIKVGK